jgi:hypothetical protein
MVNRPTSPWHAATTTNFPRDRAWHPHFVVYIL